MWDWLNRSHYLIITLFLCLCVSAFHRILFYQIILQISKIYILSWFCQFSGKFSVVVFVLSPGDGSQQFILPTFIVYISPLFLIDLKLCAIVFMCASILRHVIHLSKTILQTPVCCIPEFWWYFLNTETLTSCLHELKLWQTFLVWWKFDEIILYLFLLLCVLRSCSKEYSRKCNKGSLLFFIAIGLSFYK